MVSAWGESWGSAWGESWQASEVQPEPEPIPVPPLGAFMFRPRVAAVEGVAYGELPHLIGHAIGEVGNAVKARVSFPALSGTGAGAGFAARVLPDLVGRSSGVIGRDGTALSTLSIVVSASADAGSSGKAGAVLSVCGGKAMGDHDPDEASIIALLMAA